MSKEISQNIHIVDPCPLNHGSEDVQVIVADVRRYASDDLPTEDDTAKQPAPLNADDNHTPELQDLSNLVWKYFEKEIRESMVEVQEAIESE